MEPPDALVLTDTDRDITGTVRREAGRLAAFIKARVSNAADAEDILFRVNQDGKRDNQDGKFFEGAFSKPFGSDLTCLEAI